jgi:hypothetical protein
MNRGANRKSARGAAAVAIRQRLARQPAQPSARISRLNAPGRFGGYLGSRERCCGLYWAINHQLTNLPASGQERRNLVFEKELAYA